MRYALVLYVFLCYSPVLVWLLTVYTYATFVNKRNCLAIPDHEVGPPDEHAANVGGLPTSPLTC